MIDGLCEFCDHYVEDFFGDSCSLDIDFSDNNNECDDFSNDNDFWQSM